MDQVKLVEDGLQKFLLGPFLSTLTHLNWFFLNDIYAQILSFTIFINPFHAIDLFLYPLKTSENKMFSDAFKG